MKKIYVLLAALWLGSRGAVQAQTTDSLRLKLDQIFANIDKSQVPTGYLAEYATPLLPLRYYDGVLSDSNRTDMDAFRFLLGTVSSARIYGAATLPSITAG